MSTGTAALKERGWVKLMTFSPPSSETLTKGVSPVGSAAMAGRTVRDRHSAITVSREMTFFQGACFIFLTFFLFILQYSARNFGAGYVHITILYYRRAFVKAGRPGPPACAEAPV